MVPRGIRRLKKRPENIYNRDIRTTIGITWFRTAQERGM